MGPVSNRNLTQIAWGFRSVDRKTWSRFALQTPQGSQPGPLPSPAPRTVVNSQVCRKSIPEICLRCSPRTMPWYLTAGTLTGLPSVPGAGQASQSAKPVGQASRSVKPVSRSASLPLEEFALATRPPRGCSAEVARPATEVSVTAFISPRTRRSTSTATPSLASEAGYLPKCLFSRPGCGADTPGDRSR